ncbi:MAG: hypothetical protein FWF41_05390 [Betaproteobacteria bacterium]|nr:hypothetical protein [Betaproteobacteria bacterium]
MVSFLGAVVGGFVGGVLPGLLFGLPIVYWQHRRALRRDRMLEKQAEKAA